MKTPSREAPVNHPREVRATLELGRGSTGVTLVVLPCRSCWRFSPVHSDSAEDSQCDRILRLRQTVDLENGTI